MSQASAPLPHSYFTRIVLRLPRSPHCAGWGRSHGRRPIGKHQIPGVAEARTLVAISTARYSLRWRTFTVMRARSPMRSRAGSGAVAG